MKTSSLQRNFILLGLAPYLSITTFPLTTISEYETNIKAKTVNLFSPVLFSGVGRYSTFSEFANDLSTETVDTGIVACICNNVLIMGNESFEYF